MIKILSAAQIREADRYTIDQEPVSSIDLMERAAAAFSSVFIQKYSQKTPVFIFCGYGNNGGDGLAIARILLNKTYQVQVYTLADKETYAEDFVINKSRLLQLNDKVVHTLLSATDFPSITKQSVIIDALFGSGLNKPLAGFPGQLVSYLNQQDAIRVSVDMPSGLFADKISEDVIFRAHHTITFQQPKLSFLFPENQEFVGECQVVNIGLDHHFIHSLPCHNVLPEKSDLQKILRPRKKFDHKGTYGHAFIHAGSTGKTGAAILCAAACARSGAGLTTVHLPKGESSSLNTTLPEAMTYEYPSKKKTEGNMAGFSSAAFGPGIGTSAFSVKTFLRLLKIIKAPSVFDADALNIISRQKKGLGVLSKNSIITPHLKEFERLAGKTDNWSERHQRQLELSKTHSIFIILKGAFTCITTPGGMSYFNPTGNPGMAKGGSGDVLTGIIVGLLAQHYAPEEACLLGVYLHGLSGDLAVKKQSEHSLLASDIIATIGDAFANLSKRITETALFVAVLLVMLSSCGTQKKATTPGSSPSTSGKISPDRNESTGEHTNESSSRFRFYQDKYAAVLGTSASLNSLSLYEFIDHWLNTPYKYGGNSKSGVDCSRLSTMLMRVVYQKTISGSSADIFKQTNPISKKELKEGDLVFFKINTTAVGHMGVYLVNHKFIHSTTHAGVVISDLNDDYYNRYFFAAGRIK